MPVAFVTVPDVELCATGTYALASGPATFTAEDLAAAVLASQDPTVPAPRIKLGHTDPRFDEAVASGQLDGEPAFGTVQNMHLSDDGQHIIGDLVDVPEWLAETMQSSYPGRSIEGGFGYTAPSGRSYSLVIAGLALLGVQWPGVTSLADLREILEANGEAPADAEAALVAASGGTLDRQIAAHIAPRALVAGLDLGSIQRQFIADLDEGEVPMPSSTGSEGPAEVGPQIWWWPRSVRVEDDGSLVLIVDDDEGHLLRVPFTVDGNELTYSTPEVVVETYVPVAAAAGQTGPRALASWPTRAAARPVHEPEADSPMNDDQRRALAVALGQPEDTTEDRLHEIAAERAANPPEPEPTPEPEVTPPPAQIPDGMTLVDQATLDTLREGAESGLAVAARLATQDRDAAIAQAVRDGRIAVAARGDFETRWDRDPDGTRTLLTAEVQAGGLPLGTVPAGMREVGHTGEGEGEAATVDADHEAFMRRHNPQVAARLAARHERGRLRVRTEV
jgi:hypothetical protein